MLKAIVCVSYDEKNKNNQYAWGIGKVNKETNKGELLFNLPTDLKYFKETTLNHTVVLGYNTLLSLPGGKPLKDRKTIVICPEGIEPEGCLVFHKGNECRKYVQELAKIEDVYICGGAMTYSLFNYYCEEVLVTKVYHIDPDATAFYPNLDKNDLKRCVWESELYEENGYKFRFTKYKTVHLTNTYNIDIDDIDTFNKWL